MKRILAFILALVLALSLCACGEKPSGEEVSKPEPATPNTSADAPVDNGDESAEEFDWSTETKKYKLTFADSNVETAFCARGTAEAIKYIEEKSNGCIEITPYFGGTLAESADLISAVSDGIADIVYITPSLYAGNFKANDIFNLKYFTEMPDIKGIFACYREAMDTMPVLQEELAKLNAHCIDVFCTQPNFYGFHGDDALDVYTPEDLKGLVVQASGDYATVLSGHGITPLSMGPPDWYTNFERNIVNVNLLHWIQGEDFGLHELIGSYLLLGNTGGFCAVTQMVLFNQDSWSALPEHVQELITEGFRYGYDWMLEEETKHAEEIKAEQLANKPVQYIPEEDMQPWYDLALEQAEIWKAGCNEAGYDADAIFNDFYAIIENYVATH